MKQDTLDFLNTLLWVAADNEPDADPVRKELANKTVYDFSPEFQAGAEKFVDAFRAHLESVGFPVDKLDRAERSFGGNVYFSLSGHGCGFFDDCDPEIAGIQEIIQAWARTPNNPALRFEELESELEVGEDGKVDLCIRAEVIERVRDALFAVPEPEKVKPEGGHTPTWMDCGEGVLLDPTTHKPVGTRVVEAKGWGRVFEVYDYSDAPERNFSMILAAPEMLQALEYAAELIDVARKHFPKSMSNSDKFQLENTCAAVGKAISKAKGL